MANLTNSAKLIEEMEKKAYTSDLWAAALSNQYQDLDWLPTLPTVNDSTITIKKNGTAVDSFTTNAAEGKNINITITASDVGLGNVDNTSDLNKPISSATQTALNLKANSADVYTSAQTDSAISSAIDSALSSVFVYKGSKASYDQLPSSWNKKWDVWNVETAHTTDPVFDAGTNVAWNGSGWDPLAGTINLSWYFNKNSDTSDNITQWSTNLFVTSSEKTTWNDKTKVSLVTQTQYDNLWPEKLTNGVLYWIVEN